MNSWLIVAYQFVVSALCIWLVNRPEAAVESFSSKFRYLLLGLGTLAGANAVYCIVGDYSASATFTTMLIALVTMVTASFNAGRYYRLKHYKHMVLGTVLGYLSMLIFSLYLIKIELG
jgi:drug/metabolite transporter (DMT)-like permease